MTIKFEKVTNGDLDKYRWLRWLDAEVFPNDKPFVFEPASWFIGWDGADGIAYCGWKPIQFGLPGSAKTVGFHYRAGVLESHRGQGLQKLMISLREDDMKKYHITLATSYTEPYSAASMCSLISCGYRPYESTDVTALTTLDRYKRFIHWKKSI